MTPKQFQSLTVRIVQKLITEVPKAETATANAGKAKGISLSNGGYSTASLRIMGHPYRLPMALNGKRTVRPPQNAAIINRQTGQFEASWRVVPSDLLQGDLITRIANIDTVAKYLAFGTRRMIPRPFLDAILKTVKPIRTRNLRRALRTAFSIK